MVLSNLAKIISLLVWMAVCLDTSKNSRFLWSAWNLSVSHSRFSNFWVLAFRPNQAIFYAKLSESPSWASRSSIIPPFQKQLWTCEIEFLSLGCWVKEWLTIYYGTQSTGKNQPWNQTLWSWPLFLTFLIIRCFNLPCCVKSQFWKFWPTMLNRLPDKHKVPFTHAFLQKIS